MQRWLSWSKAHDWKSCVRLITDREFESLPLREIRKRIFMVLFFFLQRKSESNFLFLRLLYSSKKLHGNEDSLYPK